MFKNLSPKALGVSGSQSELIELALSFGFKGIDLDLADFHAQSLSAGLDKARRLLDSSKLRIGCFDLPVRLQTDEAAFQAGLGALAEQAKSAAAVGATRAVVDIEPACDTRPYHQNFELHRQRISQIAAMLEPLGIRLGVGIRGAADVRKSKSFQFIHEPDALNMLLGMVRERNVGVAVDLWDWYLAGKSPEDVRALGKDRIVAVRVADMPSDLQPAELPHDARLLPGETGVVPIAAALVALAEIGYDGPVTPTPSRLKGLGREGIVKQTGSALDQIWKTAGLGPTGKLLQAGRR